MCWKKKILRVTSEMYHVCLFTKTENKMAPADTRTDIHQTLLRLCLSNLLRVRELSPPSTVLDSDEIRIHQRFLG